MARTKEKESKGNTSQSILEAYLKDNQDDHFNFYEEIFYRVPTGSLVLDIEMGGGFTPGLHRFTGINSGGKTSESLEVMRNFFKTVPNSRGVYIKAEGRLGEDIRDRSGLTFVFSAEEWEEKTCFVFECNIYETVFSLIKQLIKNNEDGVRYMFIIDSVDGLQLKDDEVKGLDESAKVAGGALISSTFMKKVALAMSKFGHLCILISQVRSEIKLDPYAKTVYRQTTATGGNALLHYANWILEFEPQYKGDLVLQDVTNKKIDRLDNPAIGHWAKVTIKKSPNEKNNLTIAYPIKYGRKDGKSVWIEYEIIEMLGMFGFIEVKGAWTYFSEKLLEEVRTQGIEIEDKIQGKDAFREYLEQNEKLTEYLYNKFKNTLTKTV